MIKKINFMLIILSLVIFSSFAYSLTETLSVETCNAAGCTVAGWNDFDSVGDGSTLGPGGVDFIRMSNQTFLSTATINFITVLYNHDADGGVDGSIRLDFKNDAQDTTYCTNFTSHTTVYSYDDSTPPSCGWTYDKLKDLTIVLTHTGTKNKNLYNDYINFTIDYTPFSDSTAPTISLGLPGNDTWTTVLFNTFYFTPTDTQSTINNCTLILNNIDNETTSPITNGSQNSIASTLSDGFWWWTVNCTDSWNNIGIATPQKYLKVDTQGPQVNLETPLNSTPWTISQTVDFKFNSTDAMTTLLNCSLIIDGDVKDTKPSPVEGTSLTFSFAPGNEEHNWSVNCMDSNNFETSSEIRNVSVNYAGRTVLTDSGSYEQGSNVTITGANWADGTVTINMTLSNGTSELWNTTAIGGSISTYYYVNYSHPIGQYNLSAFEYLTPVNNATNMFTVTERIVLLTVGSSFKQGETIQINGSGFSPNNTVTLNITWGTGSNITTQNLDTNGKFTFDFYTNYTFWTGLYNIIAIDDIYLNLNDTANFTLYSRIPVLNTTGSSFGENELIDFFGYNFSIYGDIQLTLFQNSTGKPAPTYPRLETANYSGDFYHFWNTTDTCPGVYALRAEDQNYTNYNETIYFNLTGSSVDYTYFPNETSGFNPGTASNLDTSGDSNEESLALTATHSILMRFNNTISPDATVSSASFRIDHRASAANRGQLDQIEWLNGNTWVTVCTYNSNFADINQRTDNCDLSPYITNGSQANDIQLRINYTRTGGPLTIFVDYGRIDIIAGGSATCTDWGNQIPTISKIDLDDYYDVPANQIDLVVGSLTPVYCNVTASDQDGYQNIINASATFYYYLNKSSDPDDNNTHYTNSNCTETGNNGVYDKYFMCGFNITYYANNGTWNCNATIYDNSSRTATSNITVTVNTLYALNLSTTLDFGDIQIGSTSLDTNMTISNFGNMEIDVGLDAYGVVDGDNISMDCTIANLSMNNLRYNLSYGTAFNAMTPITDTLTTLNNFNLSKQTNSTLSQKDIYWKINPTPPAFGECTGTLVVTAMNA